MTLPRKKMLAGIGRGLIAAAAASSAPAASAASEWPPALRTGDAGRHERWLLLHETYVARAASGSIAGLFLGDSLTFGWLVTGRSIFDLVYLPRRIQAFGIGGDRTADLLWRIRNGELSGPSPRVISILIGTNDLDLGAKAVVAGIVACVEAARAAAPAAAILLLGLLPRGFGGANERLRREIETVNEALARLGDGGPVHFLDFGRAFLRADGSLQPALFERDLVHLSLEGYAVWARAMARTFDALLA